MTLQKPKPTSPGMRGVIRVKDATLHKGEPHAPLLRPKKRGSGRNNRGRITVRHRGGGARRRYREIDFKRLKDGVPARVERIEYDPNRSARIALLVYLDGERRYIISPEGLSPGDRLLSGPDASAQQIGNCLPLEKIPLGTMVHCVEAKPGKGAQFVRSAGAGAQLIAREQGYALLRLRSGEIRRFLVVCRAVIGTVSNPENNLRSLGKAGARRWRGVRPTVRGVVMNPVDHPHGGGEGRTSGGRHPVSPWGMPTKGYRTRRKSRTDRLIVRRRSKR